jgi:TonB family protein
MKTFFHLTGALLLAALCSLSAAAQSVYFNYLYTFEPVKFEGITDREPFFESPEIGKIDINYSEEARKNGVQGTVKATVTLGENGKARDIKIDQDLPFGVGAAVVSGLQAMTFKPAAINGKPVAIVMHLDYVVTLAYAEDDKSVGKVVILEKPEPVYPSKYLAEKIKGTVSVQVIFKADGTLRVGNAQSVMPKEFDRAAVEAAEHIKFQPALHKKSRQPVTQQMTVVYQFKP